jgi:hypothetical protein
MKECCLSDNQKVVVGGVRFFLGSDKEREELEDDSSDEEGVDLKKIKHQGGINKKTKKRAKVYKKALERVKRKEKKDDGSHPLNFSALHLLVRSLAHYFALFVYQGQLLSLRSAAAPGLALHDFAKMLTVTLIAQPPRLCRAALSEAFTEHEVQIHSGEQTACSTISDSTDGPGEASHHIALPLVHQILDTNPDKRDDFVSSLFSPSNGPMLTRT